LKLISIIVVYCHVAKNYRQWSQEGAPNGVMWFVGTILRVICIAHVYVMWLNSINKNLKSIHLKKWIYNINHLINSTHHLYPHTIFNNNEYDRGVLEKKKKTLKSRLEISVMWFGFRFLAHPYGDNSVVRGESILYISQISQCKLVISNDGGNFVPIL
jgi:hypothetical protein